MPAQLRKLLTRFAIGVATLVVLGALLLGAFQLAVSRVPGYRVQLQQFLQERTGLAIEFRELGARLRWRGPELVFKGLVVRTPDHTRVLVTARRGRVGFDLWNSLAARQLTAGRFTLQAPEIGLIRTLDGRIQLVGQSALPERDKPFELKQLPVGSFQVQDAIVSFRDEATARGPWALSGVSFTLDRQPNLMTLRGTAALPTALGKSLRFAGRVHGTLGQPQTLFSSFAVDGEAIDLAGWADMLPDGWPAPESGRGAVQISAAFHGMRLSNVAAKVDLQQVTAAAPAWSMPLPSADPLIVPLAPDETRSTAAPAQRDNSPAQPAQKDSSIESIGQLLSYQRVAFGLRAQQRAQGWELALHDLELSRTDSPWRSGEIQLRWHQGDAGAFELAGKADSVVLGNVWPLLAYLSESQATAQLRALGAVGVLDALSFDVQRSAAADGKDAPWRYTLNAGLQQVGVHAVGKAPGMTGISGRLRASENSGELELAAKDMQVHLPSMFRHPLSVTSLTGQLQWHREPASWHISTDSLELNSVDGQASVAMMLTLPLDGSSPLMDLRATVRDLDAGATAKYLPANKLTAKTLEWLDHAFVSGRVVEGEAIIKGPLRSFPFRRRDGQFLARARVEGMKFNYQNGWMPATDLAAQVEFRNAGMNARGITAQLGDLRIHNAHGEFPDFRQGEISVSALTRGDFQGALELLRESPVGPALGPLFARLRGRGSIESSVSLWLPLQRIENRRITVATQFADATATLDGVDAPLTSLTGSLTVQQTLLSGAELHGQLLGGPVSIRIAQDSPDTAMLTAQGHAQATKIIPFIPSLVRISGATDWQASTHLRAGAEAKKQPVQSWQVTATMDGLGVFMPYPLGKLQQGARPLHADLEIGNDLLARASYGDVRALLSVKRSKERWAFDRGGVRGDGIAAALPAHRGLRIEGDLDHIVLDDWFALRGTSSSGPASGGPASEGSGKLADILQAANVRVAQLDLYGYRWNDVRGVLQATASGWRVDAVGPDIAGQVQIPISFTGESPLTATMDRLVLQQPSNHRDGQDEASGRDPRAWPNLRVHVMDLQMDEHGVGEVDLKATRVANGLQIDSINITQAHATGEGSGNWLLTPDGERSSLALKIVSTDVGDTLRTLKYTPFMEARHAEVRADLAWNGGFGGNFLGKASGSLAVKAEAGQLSSLQPGAGRVLGLFSVAALPRRLALDFSDLTDKGLSFDSVSGDFNMREGNAYTDNLTLRGPAAEIGIAGRTGLGSHDYDQTAVVTGNLGASLPVAGVLAGGPAIGAALLLFSQVFKEPLKGITRGYYRITGSWDEPVVERVEAAAIKEASTSHLLTR
jgi:uncharacterized protein (TIGR02099 family)